MTGGADRGPAWWTSLSAGRLVRDLDPALLGHDPHRKAVLRAIADRLPGTADGCGWCWPSRAQLAADALVSEETVRRAVRGLRRAGLIETRRAWDPPDGISRPGRTSFYRLTSLVDKGSVRPLIVDSGYPQGPTRGLSDPQGTGSDRPPGRATNGRAAKSRARDQRGADETVDRGQRAASA